MHVPAAPGMTRRTALLGLAAGVLTPTALLASPAHADRAAPPTTLALPNGFPPDPFPSPAPPTTPDRTP